jgi:UDP-glucose 4-epimerase
MRMNKILVTGGAGFIGSYLIDALMHSKNYHIIAFDNLSTGKSNNIEDWVKHPNFKFMHADVLDHLSLEKAVNTSDTVCHLAANPFVAVGATNTKIDYEQNLSATFNLLEAMRKSPSCKKIIFTSTSAIYGEADVMPTSERYSPLKPISLYGATKLACEAMISSYCYMFDMSSIVVRLANIIGPVSTHGVIYDFITKLKANSEYLEILGNGKQNKSYLHIKDCINGLVQLLGLLGKVKFEIFNMGSDDTITVSEIAEIVINELSLNSVDRRLIDKFDGRGWSGDVREYLLDSSKLKAIGWTAELNSKEAVTRSVREYINKKINP